jgi:formylglycine-generating enzyme required for sulfatase activity
LNHAHQHNPPGPAESESFDPREPDGPKHVIKGGSYLCAKNYCSRYRPAARESQSPDTGTTHIGFRLASRLRRKWGYGLKFFKSAMLAACNNEQ